MTLHPPNASPWSDPLSGYSVSWYQVPVRTSIMSVRGTQFNIDQIEDSVPNTALGDDRVGKLPHPFDRSLQHDSLNTLSVIEMSMHC